MTNKKLSRRSFLKQCAIANAAGYTSAFSALGGLSLTAQAQSNSNTRPNEYRAMVCIYLTGGNDLNMLIPTDDTKYSQYVALRGPDRASSDEPGVSFRDLTIARERSNETQDVFIPIKSNSQDFGLHPSCGVENSSLGAGSGGINKLYDQGNLAFIANTGSLIQPTTATQWANKSVPLPPGIGNHLVQKDFVRAGNNDLTNGWAGRIADFYDGQQTDSPMNLTFSGDNPWQRGNVTSPYGLSGASILKMVGFREDFRADERLRRAALDRMNQLPQNHTITSELGRIANESLELSDMLRTDLSAADTEIRTVFPNSALGNRLKDIAMLIKARSALGMPQQTFYVDSGGWDMHDDLLNRHSINLEELSAAMTAFYAATVELGLENNVTTFTNSEFGRTLDPNVSGSDHGWGGTQIVMGGRINGGQVFGEFPFMSSDGGETQFRDFRGILVPTTPIDQVSSTIAKWFGDFSDNTLSEIFPNLRNFNSYDLGFIS